MRRVSLADPLKSVPYAHDIESPVDGFNRRSAYYAVYAWSGPAAYRNSQRILPLKLRSGHDCITTGGNLDVTVLYQEIICTKCKLLRERITLVIIFPRRFFETVLFLNEKPGENQTCYKSSDMRPESDPACFLRDIHGADTA